MHTVTWTTEHWGEVWVERTPLMFAVQGEHAAVVDVLLAAGADPNHTWSDATPLSLAIRVRHRELLDRLLSAGARSRGMDLIFAASWGEPDVADALVDAGADLHFGSYGVPRAVRAGHLGYARRLV